MTPLDTMFPGNRINGRLLPASSEVASIQQTGRGLLANVPWMLRQNADRLDRFRSESASEVFDRSKPEEREQLAAFIRSSLENSQRSSELAAYRSFEIQRDIIASMFALSAFQEVDLNPDELPLITRPQTQQHFGVRYTGQDGGFRNAQWTTTRQAEHIEMRTIATDKVGFPLQDIQLGTIQEFDRVNSQLRYDLEMKIDTEAKDAIDDLEAASGLRDLLTLHPQIVAANVPDKNYLDLTSTGTYGTAHKLTLPRIKAILSHFAKLRATNLGPYGGINLQSIQISPQNMEDQWDFVDLVSGYSGGPDPVAPQNTVPTSVRDQIFAGGMMNSAWGFSWTTMPNSRLDTGRLYCFTNKPVGWFFTKKSMDRTLRWDSPELQLANENFVAYQRVLQFATVAEWAINVLIVDF